MQVSKVLLTVCATAVCAGFLSARAQDNPAQAAARAALMQAMGEPAAPAAPATPPVLVESSGVVTQQTNLPAQTNETVNPAPAVVAPTAQTPVTAPQPLDSEAQAKAREALLQQMGQPPVQTPAPAATMTPAVAPAPATPATPAVAVAPAPAAPATPVAKPVAASPASAGNTNYPGMEPGFTPIVAPPLPISAAKEQQLDALLVQYKADQITPEEYHKQRAAILAGP